MPDADKAFDHAKAIFEQNFQQFRHLNEQMNRIPPFAVTLTGGFWYVAFAVKHQGQLDVDLESLARFALLIFAGICDFALVFIAIRIRDVMSVYQARMDRFQGAEWTGTGAHRSTRFGDYFMISAYSVMMVAGGTLSWIAAFTLFWPVHVITVAGGVAMVAVVVALVAGLAYIVPRWLSR